MDSLTYPILIGWKRHYCTKPKLIVGKLILQLLGLTIPCITHLMSTQCYYALTHTFNAHRHCLTAQENKNIRALLNLKTPTSDSTKVQFWMIRWLHPTYSNLHVKPPTLTPPTPTNPIAKISSNHLNFNPKIKITGFFMLKNWSCFNGSRQKAQKASTDYGLVSQ